MGTLSDEKTELYVDWCGTSPSAKYIEIFLHIRAHSQPSTHPQGEMFYDFQNLLFTTIEYMDVWSSKGT